MYITKTFRSSSIWKKGTLFIAQICYLMPHRDRPVDVHPICHCWCSAPWCHPAGKSQRYTDRPQSCWHGSPSPETSRSPEDEEAHRTLLQHTCQNIYHFLTLTGSLPIAVLSLCMSMFHTYVSLTIQTTEQCVCLCLTFTAGQRLAPLSFILAL